MPDRRTGGKFIQAEMTHIDNFIFECSYVIFVALISGFFFNWKHNLNGQGEQWRLYFHSAGWLLRGLIGMQIVGQYGFDYTLLSIYAFIAWPVWNWMINFAMEQRGLQIILYVGKTSVIDKVLSEKSLTYIAYGVIFLNLIISRFI